MRNQAKRFVNVKQASELYPAFSINSIRWLIFNKATNGFANCVKKVGRKVLLDLDAFEAFVSGDGQGGQS